jgi:hypothetical protein
MGHIDEYGVAPEIALARLGLASEIVRLGLCAAAEMLLEHVRAIYRNNPEIGRDEHLSVASEGARVIAVVLETDACEILRKAGVDPERWEAAR